MIDSLPPDWTQAFFDLRIFDEERYIEADTLLVQINVMPYSKYDWHWRLTMARSFGPAAAYETVHGRLILLDDLAIEADLVRLGELSGPKAVSLLLGWPESFRLAV